MRVLLGITGASGAVYGLRAAGALSAAGVQVHALVTATAWGILAEEAAGEPAPAGLAARQRWLRRLAGAPGLALHGEDDFRIPFASGSNPPDAMAVVPCSMGTLGRIARGVSDSVLCRCADVALKERRPLVLVPRETPLSPIHLENMLVLARAGAEILPACPGFWHRPGTVEELVDFVVHRVLARIGVELPGRPRWGEKPPGKAPPRPAPGRRRASGKESRR